MLQSVEFRGMTTCSFCHFHFKDVKRIGLKSVMCHRVSQRIKAAMHKSESESENSESGGEEEEEEDSGSELEGSASDEEQ